MTTLMLDDVTVRVQERSTASDVCILEGINLPLLAGRLTALLGPNGAGKTTLLHCASGELQPDRGVVTLNGHALGGLSHRAKARTLATLPQRSSLTFPLTVREVVALARFPHATGAELDALIVHDAMRAFDVSDLALRTYTSLSGGEQQRVQLARVVAQLAIGSALAMPEGAALLLDEPVAALDLSHQQQLMRLLRLLCQQGVAVLVVLHDINLASMYADTVAVLHEGCLFAIGEPRAVINSDLLAQVYGFDGRIVAHPDTQTPMFLPR